MTKAELEKTIQEIRSLKAMKEELLDNISALEHEIIQYMTDNNVDTEITDTAKVTYKEQTRETLDKKKLEEDLGSLDEYTKKTTYNVLRIK